MRECFGEKRIIPLHESAKEHIFRIKSLKTEDKWEASNVVQQKVWDRVSSKDAVPNER